MPFDHLYLNYNKTIDRKAQCSLDRTAQLAAALLKELMGSVQQKMPAVINLSP